jgi:hypothetical protein
MALDPSLITDVMSRWQGPQLPDPIERMAKLQALRSGVLQQQAAAQNLQTGALELQQRQKAIADQEAIDNAFKTGMTPDADGNLTLSPSILNSLAAGGHGAAIPGLTKTFADANKSTVDLKAAQLKQKAATDDYVASHLQTIADSKWNPDIALATVGKAVQDGVLPAAQGAQFGAQIRANPTPENVQGLIQPLLNQSQLNREQQTKAQTAQAAADRAAAAGKTATTGAEKEQAELGGIKADTAQKVRAGDATALESAFTQGGPDAFNAALGALRQQDPARADVFAGVKNVQDIRNLGMTPEQRTTAAQAAAREAATEADRKITQGQRDRQIGIEGQNAAINAKKFAMEQGGVYAGLSPQDRGKAETAYDKDTKDFTDKISTARGLQDLIAQAQGGNKAAPALIPIDELRGFVNRVNAAELRSVGVNAGSVVDQLQGYINGKLKGEPLPPALLNDMLAVSKGQELAAHRTYAGRLAANKAAFGASPPPIDIEGVYANAAAPGGAAQPIDATGPDGRARATQAPAGSRIKTPRGWVIKQPDGSFAPVQ